MRADVDNHQNGTKTNYSGFFGKNKKRWQESTYFQKKANKSAAAV